MPILTLANQPISLEAVWHHYVDQRPSPLQYSLVIDTQEITQLACVTRYAGCPLDHPLLETRIRLKDATARSMGLLWHLLVEWQRSGLIRRKNETLITYTLHNITHVTWADERLLIRGGADR